MASNKCRDLMRQAHSSRMKHTYSALVEIRKKFMKTPKEVAVLVDNGLVKRLLDLIRSRDSLEEHYRTKVIDVSLSILSNMCMEDVARKKVLKDKGTGVTIIVELFEELESECLQNRACRCLSNLLLNPGSWELVCTSSVIEKVVKLLKDTEKEEYQQTCIRALRLFGQTCSHVQKLVEKNAVSVVLKLIDSDTVSLKQSSLRCVHSLSNHGCTIQFASQVIASGKLSYLLTQVKDSNIEVFQVVIRLCEYHNFRAEFGNVGGISLFKDMFLSSEPFHRKLKEDLLSVLCQCSKEAVNRVKLRDENILILFIQALSETKQTNLHARIISAFVCFLYDETSFDVLLENGLVPLLVEKLKSSLMLETDGNAVENGTESKNEEKLKQNAPDEAEIECCESFTAKQKDSNEEDERKNETKQNITTPSSNTEQIKGRERAKVKKKAVQNILETSDAENDHVKEGNMEDETGAKFDRCKEEPDKEQSGDVFKDVSDDDYEGHEIDLCKKKTTRPVYSMDSPTYQPNIEWEYEDYGGAKCIERFTPPHSVDYSAKTPYSPLSDSSYYSPVESSPENRVESSPDYSPPSSPDISPMLGAASRNIFPQTSPPGCHGYSPLAGSQSPENFHPKYPKYTGVSCGLYTSSVSPETEKNRSKLPDQSNVSNPVGPFENDLDVSPGAVSPSPFDELSEDTLNVEGSEEHSVTYQTNGNADNVKDEKSHSDLFPQSCADTKCKDTSVEVCQSLILDTESHENINKNLSKLKEMLLLEERCRTKRKKVSSRSNVTEYNILILLSRVSQMTNPTMHLVTKEVLQCLLDYISMMEAPLARCPRLLSRVFRNPMSFSKVLTHCCPTSIFDKLLKYEHLPTLANGLREQRKNIRRKSSYGKAEIQHEIETDSDRFSMSDDSLIEEQALKRRRTSVDCQKRSHSFKGQYHRQEENTCDMGKSAMAFLEDLSGVVDSNYGRGVIDRLLHTTPRDQTTELCINILYITWTEASRQHFFNQREVLDQVLNILQPSCSIDNKQFVHVLNGLRLLVNVIDTKSKYQTRKTKSLLTKKTAESPYFGNTFKDKVKKKSLSDHFAKVLVEDIKESDKKSRLNADVCGKSVAMESSGSNVAMITKCCLINGSVAVDTVFVVKNEKVGANRAKLVEKSEIFAAMLEGHYSEAKMSEISIPESSKFALEVLIHHLHGCEIGGCEYIDQIYKQTVNKHTAEECVKLLEESNKYMVSELHDLASEYLFLRYIIPDSVFSVLKYAVLHRNDNLLKAAVSCIFYDCKRTDEVVEHLCEILISSYADIFLATLREILTE